jgi:hypothetical protein
MKNTGLAILVAGTCLIWSCTKKTDQPANEDPTSSGTTGATTGGTTGSTPTPSVEGALSKFVNVMTEGSAKAWVIESKDANGGNLGDQGYKLVFAKATTTVSSNQTKDPNDTTKWITDINSGTVMLRAYQFAPGINVESPGSLTYYVGITNGLPKSLHRGGPPNDTWSVTASTDSEFSVLNVAGYSVMDKSTIKHTSSTLPTGFVIPTPTTTSGHCAAHTWTRTECGVLQTKEIRSNSTARLSDTDCAGTMSRVVEWNWQEISPGTIKWTYTLFTIGSSPVIPLPAPETMTYTCSEHSFSTGGVTWFR